MSDGPFERRLGAVVLEERATRVLEDGLDVRQSNVDPDAERADALAAAVQAGQERAEEIRTLVDRSLARIGKAIEGVRVEDLEGQAEAHEVAERFSAVFDDACDRLYKLFEEQRARLSSFNVVLFGRTGTGKSSTITALVRGDGAGISPGRMDWTDDVLDLRWRDDVLRVKDTPGTQGPRAAELATIARTEVELADVVVLAFDDGSQLRGEFREVARHVKALGKPAIALLNVKNKSWGFPERTADLREQRGLAKDVRDHAGHIREQLTALGLFDVPIVAISAQRAVYARAADTYRGPDARRCERLRKRDGREFLLERSNFVVLETLLDALATHDPAQLRTAMLTQQASAVLKETARESRNLAERAELLAGTLDGAIKQLLQLTGHPKHFREPNEPDDETRLAALKDALNELEELRGGGYGLGSAGELEALAIRYVTAQLAGVEDETHARARIEIGQAMRGGRKLTETEFNRKVFKDEDVKRAADVAASQLGSYMQTRVETIAFALAYEMAALRLSDVQIEGDAGRAADRLATGLSLTKLTVPLAAIAATQFWNPGFWIGAAAIVLSSIAASIAAKLAKFFGGKSTQQREGEITRAIATTERGIREVFADQRRKVVDHLIDAGRAQLAEKLLNLITAARTLRQITRAATESSVALGEAVGRLPQERQPAQAAVKAAQVITADRLGSEGADLWLFERWVKAGAGDEKRLSGQAVLPTPRIPRSLGRSVAPAAVDLWLDSVVNRLDGDHNTAKRIETLRADRAGLPTVAVVGDYSTGKTSFLRRLHWEHGLPAPKRLRVGATAETDSVHSYVLGRLEFLDTPGYQSGGSGNDQVATRQALLGAAAVLFLFGPSLLTGTPEEVDVILGSLESQARLKLIDRTFWVINCIDELSADPIDDPEDFLAACADKRQELKQQLEARVPLASIGGTVDLKRILCTASDPYGLLANRRRVDAARLERHASWDGMRNVRRMLTRLEPKLDRGAAPAGRVERGVLTLFETGGVLFERARVRRERAAQLEDVARACDGEVQGGRALHASLRQGGRDVARARITTLVGELSDPKLRPDRERRLGEWWEDELLHARMDSWQQQAAEELEAWRLSAETRVEALRSSAEFRTAWEQEGVGLAVPSTSNGDGGKRKQAPKKAREFAGALGKVDRPLILKLGHRVGYKFPPWGATKLANRFTTAGKAAGRASFFLAAAAAVWDLAKMKGQRRKAKETEKRFHQALVQLLDDVDAWVDEGLEGDREEPGILRALDSGLEELTDKAQSCRHTIRREIRTATRFEERAATHRHSLDDGLSLLRRPKKTVAQWN